MALSEAEARELVERFGSQKAAAAAAGVHRNTIYNALNRERAREWTRAASQSYRDRYPGRHAENHRRYWLSLSPAERARQQLAERRRKALAAKRETNFSIATEIEILEGGQ